MTSLATRLKPGFREPLKQPPPFHYGYSFHIKGLAGEVIEKPLPKCGSCSSGNMLLPDETFGVQLKAIVLIIAYGWMFYSPLERWIV
jgi:hypothetical protein